MITYSSDEFKKLRENNNILNDNIKQIVSKLVVKPCFINKYAKSNNHKSNNNKSNIWRKPRPIIGKPIKTDIDKNKRNINSLLNKISKNNFDVIFKKIICNLKDEKDELFEFIIKNIFEKSIIQPFYCPCYVKLYLELINFNNIFKDMIINICSEYFDMIKYYKKMLNENIKDTNYDTFCLIIKNKNKKKGFSQFIGELYLNNIIELEAINKIISILINNINKIITENEFDIIENNILCLTVLLNTIHKDINKLDNIDKYLKTIEGFSKNKKIMKRLQFKLMDLLDNIKN